MSARHHLVPQFYLRNFADSQRVALVDRDNPSRVIVNAVRKACAEVGFYRIETEVLAREEDRRDHDPEVVEHHLSLFERAAAPAIYKLLRSGFSDITTDDWYHLIQFVALQTVRGHRWREDFNATATQTMRVHLGDSISDDQIRSWLIGDGKPATPQAISDFRADILGPNRPRLVAPNVVLIQEGIKLALGDLGERLADNTHWSLIVSDQVRVLTSDEPVCWWAPGDGPVGYGNAKVVWLPLDRRTILQLRDGDATDDALGLPSTDTPAGRDELCRLVNLEVATQAHRWIVHHPQDAPLEGVQLPTRTAWGDQLIEFEDDGSTRRELWIHRRLPAAHS